MLNNLNNNKMKETIITKIDVMNENIIKDEKQPIGASLSGAETTTVSKSKKTIEKPGPDVKAVQDEAIQMMVGDPIYHAIMIPDTDNVAINLTAAFKDGVEVYRLSNNRTHGKDMNKTGESIFTFGSQVPLVVMPLEVAKAAGMQYERFATDPRKDEPCNEQDCFITVEGNGRMEYALSQPIENWPVITAVLPSADALGELHPEKSFIETNINDCTWGSKDYIILRTADTTCHPGWKVVKDLEDEGWPFTIATIWATGKEGTVNKRTILNAEADADTIFANIDYCKRIYTAAVDTFGKSQGSVLMTKAMPNKIFACWDDLKNTNLNIEEATDAMVDFLKSIKGGVSCDIDKSKKTGDKDRDTVRKERFNDAFIEYKKEHSI